MTTQTLPEHNANPEHSGQAIILDGRALAAELRQQCTSEIAFLKQRHSILPGLGVVLVGEDEASHQYVRVIESTFLKAGLRVSIIPLPADTSRPTLQAEIERLNVLPEIAGIIVQMPLPPHLSPNDVLDVLDPRKDVDGIHPLNVGNLALGRDCYVPATPAGGLALLDHYGISVDGKHALVVGRSGVVGKPMFQLLLSRNATVTIAHSHTHNLDELVAQADVIASAVGKPGLIKGEIIKRGAVILDFGTTAVDGHIRGDVDFDAALERAGAITSVPGGTGPMTNAMLLKNTIKAIRRSLAGGQMIEGSKQQQ